MIPPMIEELNKLGLIKEDAKVTKERWQKRVTLKERITIKN